ncbi:unnamed protein product [Ceutorhynchus assimilis]|uniref:Lipase domain-containing protein n=1 Tax=Ceutorhynchus assimilis TaxID=467358 RepID=A0A9N9MH84_9CUCU|nr:unnamed protein product [Ceutorhynchus assimilis]
MSAAVAGTVIGLSLLAAGTIFTISKIFEGSSSNEVDIGGQIVIDPNGPEVQFVLFTRNNTPYLLSPENNATFNNSGFDLDNPTKIVTHGFMSGIKNDVFTSIRDSYLDSGYYNVIGMDWSALCQTEYVSAMRGAKIAGQHLGDFINWLSLNQVQLEMIHLIGHSLGAHVAGIGGDLVRGGRVGRITGLDPAGPGYGDVREDHLKLDRQDAKLVEVVHTFMKVIGTARPSGHVDFYPNGGQFQPGCPELTSLKVAGSIFCNHGRSFELYAESIRNPWAFKSYKCKSLGEALQGECLQETVVYMGQEETYENGLYYFKTRSEKPFSLDGVEPKLNTHN